MIDFFANLYMKYIYVDRQRYRIWIDFSDIFIKHIEDVYLSPAC